ncbi:helicase associated domain-containing protein [Tsukamurella tyrosinosolvens]|uniref:Helicase associated domain-containing protein n=1 Tax=Tsukamurella tyrosinosolvens TaxID=57704 RepID=A0A1H4VTN5_TSUTY|nr:helicase associated domain-containing protein [Tsukamurella tyrosinosolvens]KXO90902.1 hypothetical protein AXK58_20940 [Tsukamurella tyrosinosolvens]SEC83644.1 Helicase associated domain-containing protein [Tsukamurella tyrosinosolvens]
MEHDSGREGTSEQRRRLDYDAAWQQRFLLVAERDARGLPLHGAWRTAWLSRQRRAHAAGTLSAGRAAALESLASFSWHPAADSWSRSLRRLQDFAEARGRMPTRADDQNLAGWAAAQRFALRNGTLAPERCSALRALPGWTEAANTTRSAPTWFARVDDLLEHVERAGRMPRTQSPDPAEAALARWVSTQRAQRRGGTLSAYRRHALETVPGWKWRGHDSAWEANFQLARATPPVEIRPGHPIYGWVIRQRRAHRAGRLTPRRAQQLESLRLLDARVRSRR